MNILRENRRVLRQWSEEELYRNPYEYYHTIVAHKLKTILISVESCRLVSWSHTFGDPTVYSLLTADNSTGIVCYYYHVGKKQDFCVEAQVSNILNSR